MGKLAANQVLIMVNKRIVSVSLLTSVNAIRWIVHTQKHTHFIIKNQSFVH